MTFRPTDKVRVDTVFISSNIEQGLDETKKSGEAFRFRLTASPRKGRWHDMGIFFFGEELDITDMGYQISNDWLFLGSQNGLKFSDYDESSVFLSNEFEVGYSFESNADLDKSSQSTYLS